MSEKLLSLAWSAPVRIETIRENRQVLPWSSGVYVLTLYDGPLVKNNGVLYVGKAKSLRKRVSSYLPSPFDLRLLSPRKKDGRASRSLRHVGKNLLLMEIQQKSQYGQFESGVWLRWFEVRQPAVLEKSLIEYFQPAFNTALNPRY